MQKPLLEPFVHIYNMEVLPQIASQGLLGVLLVGSISVNGFLFRELSKSKEARIDDLKELNALNAQTISSFRETLTTILTIVKNIQDNDRRQ